MSVNVTPLLQRVIMPRKVAVPGCLSSGLTFSSLSWLPISYLKYSLPVTGPRGYPYTQYKTELWVNICYDTTKHYIILVLQITIKTYS
jgi:hypothetical protein